MSEINYSEIGFNEVKRINDRLYLVGEHQYACDVLIDVLSPKFLRPLLFDPTRGLWLYHVDAHSDMSPSLLTGGHYDSKTLQKIFRTAQELRAGKKVDTGLLKRAKGGRNCCVTFMAETGLVDKVIFVANPGYDFKGNIRQGVLPQSVQKLDGSNVQVVMADLDNFSQAPSDVNIFWSIDTDIMAIGRNDRRLPKEEITANSATNLASILKENGLNLKSKRQFAAISQEKNAFGYHPNAGEIVEKLVVGLQK